jgi:hypothetical protein
MAVERHGETEMAGALFFEMNESMCVDDGIGAHFEREIVAAEFALVTNAGVEPPYGGVEEEESFRDGLEDVPEEVGAAHMSQLVRKNDFKLVGTE